jgi:ParB family chromosome partitioning protein
MPEKPRRLGRGLEALIAGVQEADLVPPRREDNARGADSIELPIQAIRTNPFQPRRDFDPAELAALESSIRSSGLLQPITVREVASGEYQLVAGERRLRAASRLGWTAIPALVRRFDDQAMLVMALVENLQRADLNPLDEALGYRRLLDEFRLSQQEVATAVGKDRSTIANLLRVLALPDGIQRLVREGRLSMGHARALLSLPDERAMLDVARRTVDEQLSVRDVERLTQLDRKGSSQQRSSRRTAGPAGSRPASSTQVRRLADALRRRLQTDVSIDVSAGDAGQVSISFYSADDLQRVVELILGHSADHA